MNKGKALFLSYDGMTDPLGQSQVLPYLAGLSAKGHRISVISFEKPERFRQSKAAIEKLCRESNLDWHPLPYTKTPPVLSTMKDLKVMQAKARELCRHGMDLIHCRSYLPALTGLEMKKQMQIPFLFDMRGFWADERVEGGIWSLKNPMYSFIYRFFKSKEKEFLREAASVISLTEAGKKIIHEMTEKEGFTADVHVIPCSADFDLFQIPDEQRRMKARETLKVTADTLLISYLGSVGTWYMLNEMLDFFKVVLEKNSKARFYFLTPEDPSVILQPAKKKGIPDEHFIIDFSGRKELPQKLAAADAGLFFIKPCFSKAASSPTKLGEYLAMGIPVISNSGVGDVEDIIKSTGSGILIGDFRKDSYVKAAESLADLCRNDKNSIRQKAFEYYSLQNAVDKYDSVYQDILNKAGK